MVNFDNFIWPWKLIFLFIIIPLNKVLGIIILESLYPSVFRPHSGLWPISAFPLNLQSRIFACSLPMSQGYTLLISGSRGRGHNAWFLPITAISLHILSQNFTDRLPSSQGCAYYIIFQDKLTRSHNIYYQKWSPTHNCVSFTPILKLGTHTPNESEKTLFAFKVKRSEGKVTGIQKLKIITGPYLLSFYLSSWKLVHRLPTRQRWPLLIVGSKVSSNKILDFHDIVDIQVFISNCI